MNPSQPTTVQTQPEGSINTWAIVELFGHAKIAGKISEKSVAGTNMLVVDVPDTSKQPAFTRLLGGGAIYAINPCTEDLARMAAESINASPIIPYDLEWALAKRVEKRAAEMATDTKLLDDGGREDEYPDDEY